MKWDNLRFRSGAAAAAAAAVNGLAGAYAAAAAAANNIIGLTAALGAVILRDNATPIGGTLFGVQNSAGTSKYLDVTAASGAAVTGLQPATDFATSSVTVGTAGNRFGGGYIGHLVMTAVQAYADADKSIGLGGYANRFSYAWIGGGVSFGYSGQAANYSPANDTDCIIGVTSTAAARTITLPSASAGGAAGRFYVVKDESGAAATNNITITAAAGAIDGAANVKITTNYGAVRLYSNGANWFTV
jgi:hypothetical protein